MEETQNQVHTCKWAGNMATKMRCKFDAVKSNCPVLCGVPCRYKSESPSSSPVTRTSESPSSSPVFEGGNISESNKGTGTEKTKEWPYVIVFGTIGGLITAVGIAIAVRNKDHPVRKMLSMKSKSSEGLEPTISDEAAESGYNNCFGWIPSSPDVPEPVNDLTHWPDTEESVHSPTGSSHENENYPKHWPDTEEAVQSPNGSSYGNFMSRKFAGPSMNV